MEAKKSMKFEVGKKALLIFGVVLVMGFVMAQDSFFDIFVDLRDVDQFERMCSRDCNRGIRDGFNVCNDEYKVMRDECKEMKNEAFDACKELRGRERSDCRKAATNVDRGCRDTARDNRDMCKDDVHFDKDACIVGCRLTSCEIVNTDRDEDGVLDLLDNCPEDANPGQEDSNGDGAGDACNVPEGEILCCFGGPNGECYFEEIDNCREQGGAVTGCLPDEVPGDVVVEGVASNDSVVSFNASDMVLVDLMNNVTASGVDNNTYVAGSYECGDFAHDLERNLTADGYTATWTAIWCYGGAGNPPATAHAVTDVHLADGRTVWIEPQTGKIINMDMDGDGTVEYNNGGYVPGQGQGTTDDNCKISYFDDRSKAALAGVPGA